MSLINLQKKIGVTADGAFGPGTFKKAAAFYKLSPNRAAHFFAQTAHESGGFKAFSENLNYGAKGLRSIFRKYFPTEAMARAYERQPKRLLIGYMQTAWAMVMKRLGMAGSSVDVALSNLLAKQITKLSQTTLDAKK